VQKEMRAKREATKCLSNKAVQCLSVAKMQNHICMQAEYQSWNLYRLACVEVEEKMIQ
jgi:hypothetical protein